MKALYRRVKSTKASVLKILSSPFTFWVSSGTTVNLSEPHLYNEDYSHLVSSNVLVCASSS